MAEYKNLEQKDFLTTVLLSLFLGLIGVDRFYLGKVGTGILKLLTFGGIGVWYLIDLILILTGAMTDKKGNKLAGRDKNIKIALIIVAVVFVFGIILQVAKGGTAESVIEESSVKPSENQSQETVSPADVEEVSPAASPESSVSAEYKAALKKATLYANSMNMSKIAVFEQLTSEYGEKFPQDAAQYAMDNVQADWNKNALAKAKTYQEQMSMSTEAIRDQLTSEYGEKFTIEEADYAIQNLSD